MAGFRLSPDKLGMIVDRGHDFPADIQAKLDSFGQEMWLYRDDTSRGTTRDLNEYKGDLRGCVLRIYIRNSVVLRAMTFPDSDISLHAYALLRVISPTPSTPNPQPSTSYVPRLARRTLSRVFEKPKDGTR